MKSLKINLILAIAGLSYLQSFGTYKDAEINFEATTNVVISSKKEKTRVYPASLTKLMTAYIILKKKSNLKDKTQISKNAWGHNFGNSSRMFLEPGMVITLDQLMKGLLVQSGNDAAVALAEYHSGNLNSFVREMNSTARKLNMNNTNFENPHGRHHNNHYTTAEDFKRLIVAIIKETPEIIKYTKMPDYTFNGIYQKNRNSTLSFADAVGMKTGFTPQSGYNLVACYDLNNGVFCSISFGEESLEERLKKASEIHEIFKYNYKVTEIESHSIDTLMNGVTKKRITTKSSIILTQCGVTPLIKIDIRNTPSGIKAEEKITYANDKNDTCTEKTTRHFVPRLR